MAGKRIFTSFAIEDKHFRDLLKGQALNAKSPFEFTDMSVKEPWDSKWKTSCRSKIKGCAGMIVLVSKNTKSADGQLWEISCAKEEGIPMLGIYTESGNRPATLPAELKGVTVKSWTWDNIKNFINSR